MDQEFQIENEKGIITDQYIIPINSLFDDFKKHLDIKNNNRVVLSGKFGIGKTYFIKEFFKKFKDQYEVFHLFPINYQINTNEDIINFLKYDILLELINKQEEIFQENEITDFLDFSNLLFMWGKDNIGNIVKSSISMIPKLGKPLKEGIALIENFNEYKKNYKCGERGVIDKYLNEIKDRKYQEIDNISHLISEKVNFIKEDRKSVLVLDDLERIDPEHIFRILNSFSACFDLHEKDINMFNFDRIIIVSDYNNLKSIFHHRYGNNTDFSGYFDKYCSVEVFKYDNKEIVKKLLDTIIDKFQFDKTMIVRGDNKRHSLFRELLGEILLKSIELDGEYKINLRELLKGLKFNISPLNINMRLRDGRDHHAPFAIKLTIKLLLTIFNGDKNRLLSVIKAIENKLVIENDKGFITDDFCYHMFKEINKKFNLSRKGSSEYIWENKKIYYNEYKLTNYRIVGDPSEKLYSSNYLFYEILYYYIDNEYYERDYDPLFENQNK